MKNILILITTLLLAISGTAAGQETREIGLRDLMLIALEENFGMETRRIEIDVTYARHEGSHGIYDYMFAQEVRWFDRESERFSTFEPSETSTLSATTSIGKLLSTGGFLEVEGSVERQVNDSIIASLNPEYTTEIAARFSQPLLRGSGRDIVETRITITDIQGEMNAARLETEALALASQVETLYWQLVVAREAVSVARQSVELFEQSLAETRLRRQEGAAAKIDEVQAEQRVSRAKSDLVDARAAVDRVEDALKTLIPGLKWETTLVPAEGLSDLPSVSQDFAALRQEAFANRPELRLNGLQQEIASINTRLAEDTARPDLHLFAEASFGGRAGEFQPNFIDRVSPYPDRDTLLDSVANIADLTNRSISAGVRYSFDFGNTAAKAEVRVSKLQEQQQGVLERQLKHAIESEIRAALREIHIANSQIAARSSAVDLAQAEYEAEQERLAAGESTAFLTLEALVQLNAARTRLVDARGRLAAAVVACRQALGTNLSAQGITLNVQ